jgi:tRNA pseudouridine55 synthase
MLREMLQSFVGEVEQVPPAYSALKIGGQRAYKLARAGKPVKLEARKVRIHNLKLTDYAYPTVKFTVKVSSGTYIRSLVEDIGQKLGTGAYTVALRRTRIGNYDIRNARHIDEMAAYLTQGSLPNR